MQQFNTDPNVQLGPQLVQECSQLSVELLQAYTMLSASISSRKQVHLHSQHFLKQTAALSKQPSTLAKTSDNNTIHENTSSTYRLW